LVHSDQYANWIFDPSHPTQGRRFINAHQQFTAQMAQAGLEVIEIKPRLATIEELARVHSLDYINEVLTDHSTSQWSGQRPDLAELSALFAGGTLTALEALLAGKAKTAIHFPGAKHHAQHDFSSGFCIFSDFAIAADIATKDHGLKVAILDIDAHHGDGTENLTADNPMVLTYSVHEKGIFPGTGNESQPEKLIFNAPLVTKQSESDLGKGDDALIHAVSDFIDQANKFKPDLIFIACGADGHREDPLSSLEYSVAGYSSVAKSIRKHFSDTPILMGGAGGYLPDTRTPEVWAGFAAELSRTKSNYSIDDEEGEKL
jgi:acetoin utilization protein AcuC